MALPSSVIELTRLNGNISNFDSSINDHNWRQTLYRALKQGKWKDVKLIFENREEAITTRLNEFQDTPLLVAVKGGQGVHFIAKLVNLMPPEALALTDRSGNNALHAVAVLGNVEVAKLLVEQNNKLPNNFNKDSYLPIHIAAKRGQREMAMYLFSVKQGDEESNPFGHAAGVTLMRFALDAGIYDLALLLLERNTKLAWEDFPLLVVLAQEPSAFPSGTVINIFSGVRLNFAGLPNSLVHHIREKSVYSFDQISRGYLALRKFISEVLEMLVPPIKNARHTKLMHNQALQLVKDTCFVIKNSDNQRASTTLRWAFLLAAQNGIHEIVKEILELFPHAITFVDEENHTALHLAVMYRHEKIFKIIHKESGSNKLFLSQLLDNKRNNILHLVSFKAKQHQLELISGAVLQMQRELQWYKEVEKFMLAQERKAKNSDGKTPLMIFNDEHRDLVTHEGQWMIGMATSCTVAASLIATVAFTAAITVPGGSSGNGLPIFSREKAFIVFALADALALLSSITCILAYLSIFTSRYAVSDFLYALPNRLIIGLISLLLSVISMMTAFSATIYLVFARENSVIIIIPIAVLACIPVALFAYMQLPPLVNMIKSTYGPSIFRLGNT